MVPDAHPGARSCLVVSCFKFQVSGMSGTLSRTPLSTISRLDPWRCDGDQCILWIWTTYLRCWILSSDLKICPTKFGKKIRKKIRKVRPSKISDGHFRHSAPLLCEGAEKGITIIKELRSSNRSWLHPAPSRSILAPSIFTFYKGAVLNSEEGENGV